MRALTIVVLVAGVARAAGAGPRIDIGVPSPSANIEEAGLALTTSHDHTHAVLTLSFTAHKVDAFAEVATPLDLPHGTRVVGMTVEISNGSTGRAAAIAMRMARTSFNRSTHLAVAPALLEYTPAERHPDRYSVRAFPVTQSHAIRVAVELELPVAATIGLATTRAIPLLRVTLDGVTQTAAPLEATIEVAVPSSTQTRRRGADHVDRTNALFAGEALSPPRPRYLDKKGRPGSRQLVDMPSMREVVAANADSELSLLELRTATNASATAIRACFPTEPGIDASVDIAFAVLPSGRVSAISIDGVPTDAARKCLVDIVGTWTFSERTELTTAMYPLTLRAVR